jgi:IclR family transcriptional regulator, acetate operon repressor
MAGRAAPADEVSTVGRTFALLSAFRDAPVLGVSELSRATGIPRTSVHRLAHQLAAVGALGRVGKRYRLGPTLFELGNLHYPSRLRHALEPFLADLQRTSGGDVALCELVGADVIVMHVAKARRPASQLLQVGARIPAHACAAGRAMLAFAPRLPYAPDEALPALTERTCVSRDALCAELARVRAEKLAVDHGEAEDGRTGVAAPVANRHGRILGSLTVIGPARSLDAAQVGESVAAMARTLRLVGQSADIDFLARAHRAPGEQSADIDFLARAHRAPGEQSADIDFLARAHSAAGEPSSETEDRDG